MQIGASVNGYYSPCFQKITKKNNILPLWGNTQTMNLNALVLENIIQCTYYKNYLSETTAFQQLTEEIYYNVCIIVRVFFESDLLLPCET